MWDYSEYQQVKIEVAERVATVTLNRPDGLNAVTNRLHHELENVWLDLASDRDVNAIVLTGAGRAFCAGADLRGVNSGELTKGDGQEQPLRSRPDLASNGRRIIENMLDVEQPIIGAINGDAIGLGATLALLCDIIVVSEKARFADTHVKIGVVAGDGGAVIWPLLIGPHRAKEFLMRGNLISGAEAGRIGMVNYAVPPEEVMTKANATRAGTGRWPDLGDSMEQAGGQQVAQGASQPDHGRGLAYEMMTFKTKDHKEAIKAFMEKRKPNYVRSKE